MCENMKNLIKEALTSKPQSQPQDLKVKEDVVDLSKFNTGKRDIYKIKSKLNSWTNKDFAYYMIRTVYKHFNKPWNITSMHLQRTVIDGIKDELLKVFGYNDNSLLKKYLDFFFENHLKLYCKEDREDEGKMFLNPKCFTFDKPMEEFYQRHIESIDGMKMQEDSVPIEENVSSDGISRSWKLGPKSLLLDYGLVVFLNWSVIKEKQDINEMGKFVLSFILENPASIPSIVNKTNSLSPYPVDLKIGKKHLDKIINLLTRKNIYLNFDIEFSNNSNLKEIF
jgi:hypothetical protein